MIKLLIFVAAAYILYKLLTGDKRKKNQASQKIQDQKVADGEMVKDPICGTYVPKDTDIRIRNGEKVHCFCSYDCRDKYMKQLESGQEIKE
ncbi:MAG: transcriptional regulator [Deltaproteobacteria bacterium]|nr:transcriptional regulator [Deltaproteobacteria bacterium]